MIIGIPVGPMTACRGCSAGTTTGMHCPGCAESAELRAKLGEVSNYALDLGNALAHRDQDVAAALADAASLREQRDEAQRGRGELAFKAESLGKLDALRAEGWSVAVHNDYRLKGRSFTFWLFTRADGRWIKGEGVTDAEAVAVAWASFYEMARPDDTREDSADNHRGEEGYDR